MFEAIDGERLARLAEPVVDADKVWILSGETSRAGALSLYSGLSMVRPHVTLLEDRTFGTDICDAGPGDAAVVMDFFRYRRHVTEAARVLARAGTAIVASASLTAGAQEKAPRQFDVVVPNHAVLIEVHGRSQGRTHRDGIHSQVVAKPIGLEHGVRHLRLVCPAIILLIFIQSVS